MIQSLRLQTTQTNMRFQARANDKQANEMKSMLPPFSTSVDRDLLRVRKELRFPLINIRIPILHRIHTWWNNRSDFGAIKNAVKQNQHRPVPFLFWGKGVKSAADYSKKLDTRLQHLAHNEKLFYQIETRQMDNNQFLTAGLFLSTQP